LFAVDVDEQVLSCVLHTSCPLLCPRFPDSWRNNIYDEELDAEPKIADRSRRRHSFDSGLPSARRPSAMWQARDTTPTASIMSTQTSGPSLISPSPTPTNENAMSQGANYFFGFLITFIILLLIFVACGVGTRRRAPWFARGRRPNQAWDPVRDDPSLQPEPMFWEAWVVGGSPEWATMMPLSASIIEGTESLTRQRLGYTSPPPPPSRRRLRPWLRRRSRNVQDQQQPTEDGISRKLQITTIVRMPSAPHPDQCEDRMDEYHIGVEYVPWKETSNSITQ